MSGTGTKLISILQLCFKKKKQYFLKNVLNFLTLWIQYERLFNTAVDHSGCLMQRWSCQCEAELQLSESVQCCQWVHVEAVETTGGLWGPSDTFPLCPAPFASEWMNHPYFLWLLRHNLNPKNARIQKGKWEFLCVCVHMCETQEQELVRGTGKNGYGLYFDIFDRSNTRAQTHVLL